MYTTVTFAEAVVDSVAATLPPPPRTVRLVRVSKLTGNVPVPSYGPNVAAVLSVKGPFVETPESKLLNGTVDPGAIVTEPVDSVAVKSGEAKLKPVSGLCSVN